MGALVVYDDLNAQIRRVQGLTTYSLAPGTREPLAALLSEMHTLAGWQALDLGEVNTSWQHHERARSAAAQSDSIPHESHAVGEQAFVLIDARATRDAIDLLDAARRRADTAAPRVLRAWLAAVHSEAFAVHGDRDAALRTFDQAADLLPSDPTYDERPYCVFTPLHLARWRGSVLARFGEPDAIAALTDALNRLDPSSVRAEARTRVDLARALAAHGERDEARIHAERAVQLAAEVGSARVHRRSSTLLAAL